MKSTNGDMFVYSSYWRTWSRILALRDTVRSRGFRLGQIEVDLTAINPTHPRMWERIKTVNIRVHNTAASGADIITDELPNAAWMLMREHLDPQLIEGLLHQDFLPLIDWEKYRKLSNGGAALADILKEGVCL